MPTQGVGQHLLAVSLVDLFLQLVQYTLAVQLLCRRDETLVDISTAHRTVLEAPLTFLSLIHI